MKILVIGSGGREHALVWKLNQSPLCSKIFRGPGKGGTEELAEEVSIQVDDVMGFADFAESNNIDLTIVGPELSLVSGVVDIFNERGLPIFGSTKGATRIESSKVFAKRLMLKNDIPTAGFRVLRKSHRALSHALAKLAEAKSCVPAINKIVIKASGLAVGKGAYICGTPAQIEQAIKEIMVDRIYKSAGDEVIVEDFVPGEEISFQALCDGKSFLPLLLSQDCKALFEGGPNTGGMGAIAPVDWVTTNMMSQANSIVSKTLNALEARGSPFSGCLYPGLKIKPNGEVVVLEFNSRFGDPEMQTILRLLKSDLLELLLACVEGRLIDVSLEWHKGYAVCVVLASGGYPGKYKVGFPITGITEAKKVDGVEIFHAGTFFSEMDGKLYTAGGRVLNMTAFGDTVAEAVKRAYAAARLIKFNKMYYRQDIWKKYL